MNGVLHLSVAFERCRGAELRRESAGLVSCKMTRCRAVDILASSVVRTSYSCNDYA